MTGSLLHSSTQHFFLHYKGNILVWCIRVTVIKIRPHQSSSLSLHKLGQVLFIFKSYFIWSGQFCSRKKCFVGQIRLASTWSNFLCKHPSSHYGTPTTFCSTGLLYQRKSWNTGKLDFIFKETLVLYTMLQLNCTKQSLSALGLK